MDQPTPAIRYSEDQSQAIAFLGEGAEHVETHAAHVFLKDGFALKLKKAIKLPYLDFSTLRLRRAALEQELKINRGFAPDLYLDVKPLARGSTGALKLGGRGKTVDWVLRMKRFPAESLLTDIIARDGLDDRLTLSLAGVIAEAHAKTAIRDWDGVGIMAALESQLFHAFTAEAELLLEDKTDQFCRLYAAQFRHAKALLAARAKAGLVRRCHGDLHARNIVVIGGRPVLFDAIEFSERIATCDVLYDLAFLVMDLLRERQRRAACLLLNRYFELRRAEENLSGLSLMPLFLATRAGVRAIVAIDKSKELRGKAAEAARLEAEAAFDQALCFLAPASPRLVAIGGMSGTGKSTLGRSLCPMLSPDPGAIHIRSDIERKVLFGVAETDRLGAEHYTPEASGRVYEAMFSRAGRALAAGYSVILDAVFARPAERAEAENIARKHHVAFEGVWLEAPSPLLKTRVSGRQGDASDATAEVVDRQLAYELGDITWTRLDASSSPQATLERAIRIILRKLPATTTHALLDA
jgi:aminoglycoside phosphotransferase family enzyme/predicted kinase